MESRPRTVAVVDDDPSMRRSIERLLAAHGLTAEVYTSTEKFYHQQETGHIGCLVLDIQFDGMSGLELRRLLTASGSKVPVIFITAVDDNSLEQEAVQTGCIAYLRKPFAAKLLIAAIEKALSSNVDN